MCGRRAGECEDRASVAEDTDSCILRGGQVAVNEAAADSKLCVFGHIVVPFVHPGAGSRVVGEKDFTGHCFPVRSHGKWIIQDIPWPPGGRHISGNRVFDGALPQEVGGNLEIANADGEAG